MSRLVWLLIATLALGGCSIFGEEDETKGWSQQKLFNEANEELRSGNFETAAKYYEILESRYPFGKYAHQSQLNVAYAYYRGGEPESAMAAANRFIKFHPKHPATAYAYYLKGLVNFNRSRGFFERFAPTDDSQRDAGAALDSYKDFETLIRNYPNTEYAEDARMRMLHLRNNLARHEVFVARYYIRRGAFLAAANRANYVVQNYQRTPAIKDALEILIDVYTRLDLPELAEDSRRVLAANANNQSLIDDPRELEEPTFGHKIWNFFGLDQE